MNENEMKFCKHCGTKIPRSAVVCTSCGCQVEDVHSNVAPAATPVVAPSIVVQNVNNNNNNNMGGMGCSPFRMCNKWISIIFCIFGGWFGLHKFYEGKIIMGIIYFCTFGLLGVGIVLDFLVLLGKPQRYPVV